jgi:hypothetical protein
MRSYKQYKNSRFLTEPDVVNRPTVTFVKAVERNVASPGEKQKIKPCAEFSELDKPLVLNMKNMEAIAEIAQTDDMDKWPGTRLTLFWDPNVTFGTKVTGGIRIKAPPVEPAKGKVDPATPVPAMVADQDEVPF